MKNDIKSFIGDLHYPEQAPRYYLTYTEAVKMLVENVYRDEELHDIKAMQMMSVVDIMSFSAAFAVRILMALLSPVIAPLFVLHDRLHKIKHLKMVFFLCNYSGSHCGYSRGFYFGYTQVRSQLARWTLR